MFRPENLPPTPQTHNMSPHHCCIPFPQTPSLLKEVERHLITALPRDKSSNMCDNGMKAEITERTVSTDARAGRYVTMAGFQYLTFCARFIHRMGYYVITKTAMYCTFNVTRRVRVTIVAVQKQ
jgi:hypothetical protein